MCRSNMHSSQNTGRFSTVTSNSIYLQFIANRSNVSDEKGLLARNILQQGKFVCLEDLGSTYLKNIYNSAIFIKHNVFSLNFWKHLFLRHEAIFMRCCCFSPDESFLFAFISTAWSRQHCYLEHTIVRYAPAQHQMLVV